RTRTAAASTSTRCGVSSCWRCGANGHWRQPCPPPPATRAAPPPNSDCVDILWTCPQNAALVAARPRDLVEQEMAVITCHDGHGLPPPKGVASAPQPVAVSLVIPVFDEAESIAAVVTEAAEVLQRCADQFEIIVVDDCSSDGSGELAEQAGARVIRHPYNRGYGNALKTGILASQHENIIICDADQTYP